MWLLLLSLALLIFAYFCRKYSNPYTLTFVFGKKGSGKSCYMVRQMHKHLRAGWHVYTDMQDIRIPGVRIISLDAFDTFRPEPHSLVCLDEVGISMDNRNFKFFPAGRRDFFKFLRKMECKAIINSQSYDVDKKVRDTVDSMLLLQAIGCWSLARPIHRTITLTQPSADAESRIADTLRFGWLFSWRLYFMPSYFRYFDSKAMPLRSEVAYRVPFAPERYAFGPLYNTIWEVIEVVKTVPDRLIRR